MFISVECPVGIPEDDVCEDVTATITLIFAPEEADGSIDLAETFLVALEAAIAGGQLNEALDILYPTGDVYIIDDTIIFPTPDDDDNSGGLGGGGVTGIVVALAVVVIIGILASRRGPSKEEEEELEPAPQTDDVEKDIEVDIDIDADYPPLGAVSPDYGRGKDAMMDNDDAIAAMSGGEDSSNAGSSGWSSSAGVSSLNTGSQDGLSADAPVAGVTIAAAPAASGSGKSKGSPTAGEASAPAAPLVTRADLDSAIEAGDWAAVGTTAALLAAASDSQSYSSQSGFVDQSVAMSKGGSLDTTALDAARAAELDHLVESGDWEGVVLAAAKYEAAEAPEGESASGGSGSRSNTAVDSSSLASSPSKAQKRQELRSEIEDLVRRVVPEEIQNVDEMMMQFRGREEELIETLRTMEERAVAQKARQGAQKQAKVQAKLKTSEERAADASAFSKAALAAAERESSKREEEEEGVAPVAARSLGTGEIMTEPTATTSEPTGATGAVEEADLKQPQKKKSIPHAQRQSALEKAIEAGDWEAVGEAAAMLSDNSLASSAATEEIQKYAEGLAVGGGSDSDLIEDSSDGLERLIERGDWTGVVKAAAKKSAQEESLTSEEEDNRRQRRLKHLKEEEEALAQASIWEAIAEQTKQEAEQSTVDQAAANAADWAIGRSLQALVQAEQGDRLTGEDSSRAGSTQPDEHLHTEDEEEV